MRKLSKNITAMTVYSEESYSSYKRVYFVKAACKQEAINLLDDAGVEVEGRHIYSAYDCTGQHFASAIRLRDVKWSGAKKRYVVTHRWGIDV